jgi:tRNA(fMet)-specific endonuclease VapC
MRSNAFSVTPLAKLLDIFPFDRHAAQAYGPVRAALERAGKKIGALDTLIAAHALSLGVTLVTHNIREFAWVKGLEVTDWTR